MKRGKTARIFSYLCHYGFIATAALAFEKLFVDKRRFSVKNAAKNATLVKGEPIQNAAVASAIADGVMSQSALCAMTDAERESENSPADGKLKILYAVHYFYPERRGGTERFTLNLAKAALAAGDIPTVLVLDANLPRSAYTARVGNMLIREYEYEGIACIGFRHIRAPRGLYYKNITECDEGMRELCRYLKAERGFDIVHATYPQPFAPFLAECHRLGVPYAVSCTDFAAVCGYATLIDRRGRICDGSECGARCSKICHSALCADYGKRYLAAREMLKGAFLRSVPSEFVAGRLGRELGLDFTVINHGISDEFDIPRRRTEVRRILYAGTLAPLKGVHLLIEAFSRIEGDLQLVIAGSGEGAYEARLRKMADERVRFVGAVDPSDMPRLYSEADLVIVPSMWHETYNFVIREALMTGAVVIGTNLGAVPEAIGEGKCGFLVDKLDPESLCAAINKALAFDLSQYEMQKFGSVSEEWEKYRIAYERAAKSSLGEQN